MTFSFSTIEIRVLGCLIEKAVTTPDYYPLALNALILACNQKSNRNPEMQLDEKSLVQALDRLRFDHQLVWSVTVPGHRGPKYKHGLLERWQLTAPQLAVLCELLLRGPQTVGELRTRTERLHAFNTLADVEATLQELIDRPDGAMVVKLPREPGRKEPRYAHLLAGAVASAAPRAESPPEPAGRPVPGDAEHLARMEQDLAALKVEIETVKTQFAEFRKQWE